MGPTVLSCRIILIRRKQPTFFKGIKLGGKYCLRWQNQNVKVRIEDDLVEVP